MKAVLIGLGSIGLMYDLDKPYLVQTHSKALALACFDVIAVDPSLQQRKLAEAHYGFETYDHVSKVPDSFQPDLIVIAATTRFHFKYFTWAQSQFPNLILIEKPLTETAEQLEDIYKMVKASDTKVMVNLIRNFDSLTLSLLGQVEKPFTVKVFYTKALIHNGIHFLSLCMKLFGPVLSYQIKTADTVAADVVFEFESGRAHFKPAKSDGSNDMHLISDNMNLDFIEGGRKIYIQKKGCPSISLSDRLNDYQASVMAKVVASFEHFDDDSFEYAYQAQKVIHSVVNEANK